MTDLDPPPFQQDYDLRSLGRSDADLRVEAKGDDLVRIARWADVAAVESFAATVRLRRHSADRFAYDADLVADIVQDCVVTLEPLRSHIERPVHRELHLTQHVRFKPGESIPLSPGAGDDEVPEEIETLTYDLAAPLLEDLVLAIDPYPRAPGVEFALAEEPVPGRESPFAVLKNLKDEG